MSPGGGAPPPRLAGAEWFTLGVDNGMINGNGEATIDVEDYSSSPDGSQDIIITDNGTEALTELTIEKFGDNDDADDIFRIDLSTFDDDFTLILDNISPGDQLVLTGVDSVVYNADGTQTVTYTGSDSQTHTLTISEDTPFGQVSHYSSSGSSGDSIVDGGEDGEVMTDGYTDWSGDEVDDATDNTIFGNGGTDTITTGGGADTIFGDFDLQYGVTPPGSGINQPTPTAEQLTFSITDAEIAAEGNKQAPAGAHILKIDLIAQEVFGEEDVVFTDDGTAPIEHLHIAKMGKEDGEQDVFRFDLSTFDDDFTITVWSEGIEDFFVFTNAQSIIDNGDGTSTITYIGSDAQSHEIIVDTGLAQLEFFTDDGGTTGNAYNDVIDGGAGNDIIDGGFGQDSIIGGAGDDTLIGNVGQDTIDGGAGNDTIYGDFPEALDPLSPPAPLAWAEELTVDIDNAAIDGNGVVEIDVATLVSDEDVSQDIIVNDGGTETINEVIVSGLGGNEIDVIRLDLTGFDDDFDFVAENVGSEDVVIFTGVDSIVDNGNGTHTITYTGSDAQTHTVVVDVNNAQLDVTFTTVDETPYANDDDIIDGGAGDDIIDGGYGADTIDGGDDNDTIIASSGDDSITGGAGADTYDATSSTSLVDEEFTVTVDGAGDVTIVKGIDGSTDTLTSVETIIADEENGDDTISFTESVEASEIVGLDGDEMGIFTPDVGDPISFGGPGEPTLGEILAGTYEPPGFGGPINPNGDYLVFGDDLEFQVDETSFDNFEEVNFSVSSMVVCFVKGSHILTRDGEKPVEKLVAGDLVLTLDNGYQPIKWIGKSTAVAKGNLAPIVIKKGAMGSTRDLYLSQQHRILLTGWQSEMLFGEPEVFVPAKALINDKTVRIVRGGLVDYYHILFEHHQIIYSEGILSESFHPGDQGISAISESARNELYGLFPEMENDPKSYGETARPCLKVKEGQLLKNDLDSFAHRFFLSSTTQRSKYPCVIFQEEQNDENVNSVVA